MYLGKVLSVSTVQERVHAFLFQNANKTVAKIPIVELY